MSTTTEQKCLVPGCEKNVRTRGLCGGHYNYALQLIASKKTTYEELEAHGKIAPALKKGGRRNQHWLMDFKNGNGDGQ